jgi:hypothetical protein
VPAFEAPEDDVLEILDALGISREGWAVSLKNEDTIVLLHYKTHLEVTIHKGVKKTWL